MPRRTFQNGKGEEKKSYCYWVFKWTCMPQVKCKQAAAALSFSFLVIETTSPFTRLIKKRKKKKHWNATLNEGVERTCTRNCETIRLLNTSWSADVVNVVFYSHPSPANLPQFVELINAKQMMYKAIIERSCLSVPRTSCSMHGAAPGSTETASPPRRLWQQRLAAAL